MTETPFSKKIKFNKDDIIHSLGNPNIHFKVLGYSGDFSQLKLQRLSDNLIFWQLYEDTNSLYEKVN